MLILLLMATAEFPRRAEKDRSKLESCWSCLKAKVIAGDYDRQLGWQTPERGEDTVQRGILMQGGILTGAVWIPHFPRLQCPGLLLQGDPLQPKEQSPGREEKRKFLPALDRKSHRICPLAEKYLPDIF